MILQSAISAIKTFLGLTDTPGSYSGQANKVAGVNAGENALEFKSHDGIDGAGSNSHSQIDTHIAGTSNPHEVTKNQVSLGNVTNDAQLKRAAGDIASFSEKASPVNADLVLIEDSADSNNKKKIQVGNLLGVVPDGSNDGELLEWNGTIWVPRLFAGSSWPAVVYAGKKFTRDDRGSGTDYFLKSVSPDIWIPERSRGPVTIYIDKAGTDDKNHGFASGSDAFLTFVGAINQISGLIGGSVIVNTAGGVYSEKISFKGINFTGNFTITFIGDLSDEESGTADTTPGTTFQKRTTLQDTGQFTGDDHTGKLIEITSGAASGDKRVIRSNTNDIITIAGYFYGDVVSGDTFTIRDFNTNITYTGGGSLPNRSTLNFNGQEGLIFQNIKFSNTDTVNNQAVLESVASNNNAQFTNCAFHSDTFLIANIRGQNVFDFNYCYFKETKNARNIIQLNNYVNWNETGCFHDYQNSGTGGSHIITAGFCVVGIVAGTTFTATNKPTYGIRMRAGSALTIDGSFTDYLRTRIDNNTTGIRFEVNSFSNSASLGSLITYTNNITDISEDEKNTYYNPA